MLVMRSTNGGTTWSNPITLKRDENPNVLNDKNTLTADPTDARYVYAAWDRLVSGGGGPAMFARSIDNGLTWEPARAIYNPGANAQTIGNVVVVLPSGALLYFFTQINFNGTTFVALAYDGAPPTPNAEGKLVFPEGTKLLLRTMRSGDQDCLPFFTAPASPCCRPWGRTSSSASTS